MSVIESAESEQKDSIVQVGITLDTEEDVRKAYGLLREGRNVDMPLGPLPWSPCAASLTDRLGVWWYITAPQHRPDDSFNPVKPLEEQL